ncbi:hypothetical protein H4S07_000042 [Coemansia furcata]|uniref:Uncharacterized protein n=1 Tax=Coemansia furcata TaxID=417177 RepID=A0ACC1LRT4_9FUNG|nr:hypothetical protein H4S07_000042 [Coemansia furcata]
MTHHRPKTTFVALCARPPIRCPTRVLLPWPLAAVIPKAPVHAAPVLPVLQTASLAGPLAATEAEPPRAARLRGAPMNRTELPQEALMNRVELRQEALMMRAELRQVGPPLEQIQAMLEQIQAMLEQIQAMLEQIQAMLVPVLLLTTPVPVLLLMTLVLLLLLLATLVLVPILHLATLVLVPILLRTRQVLLLLTLHLAKQACSPLSLLLPANEAEELLEQPRLSRE